MKRVTGIGGIFFKSDDPKSLYAWYEKHLGIKPMPTAREPLSNGVMRKARRLRASRTTPGKPRGKLCEPPKERAHKPRFTTLPWM